MSGIGWGGAPWGGSPWGSPSSASLGLVSIATIAENAIQLTFSEPVYFSGLLDPGDASDPSLYVVTPVGGTFGIDGTAARPVTPIVVTAPTIPGLLFGTVLVLTFDRPTTPFPAGYGLAISGLLTADKSGSLDPSRANGTFLATYRRIVVPAPDPPTHPAMNGDIANPQTLGATTTGGASGTSIPSSLGTFVVDLSGDYAADKGIVSYKKRVLRRLVTKKGAFLHLGASYGVDVPSYGKTLATAHARAQLKADATTQIQAEPETDSVSVSIVSSYGGVPGVFALVVNARTKSGELVRFTVPTGQRAST